jgi:hypothetical protein
MHFLRVFQTQNGYRCYDPSQKKMYVSRDVTFTEDDPYYPAIGQEEDDLNLFPLPGSSYYDQDVCSLPQQVPEVGV